MKFICWALCRVNFLGMSYHFTMSYRSEGFAPTEYDIPRCVEDGAWTLWENSSVAVVGFVVVVAHPGVGRETRDERREKREDIYD